MTLLTVMSVPADVPRGLKVLEHSVVFMFHTLTVPSEEALMMWWPSGVKVASFTNEAWPRNSLRVLPDFSPWILKQIEIETLMHVHKIILKKKKRLFGLCCSKLHKV